MKQEDWQRLYEGFETRDLLDAVDHIDEVRQSIGDEEDGCALSTKIKDNNKYYITIKTSEGLRSVIISQLRLYDTKRLQEKFDIVSQEEFYKIKTAIKLLL